MRLTSKKSSIRRDTLAWLEQAARSREPDAMQLRSHTELLPIVQVGTAAAARTHALKWAVDYRPALAHFSKGCQAAQVSCTKLWTIVQLATALCCCCQCTCTQRPRLHAPAFALKGAAAGLCRSKQLRHTDGPGPAGAPHVACRRSCRGMRGVPSSRATHCPPAVVLMVSAGCP